MASLSPQTRFGSQFKHAKGVDIIMGVLDSLSTYPHYWKFFLVIHLLIGKINFPDRLAQGWNFHQAGFCHSDLGGITNEDNSFLLLTPHNKLLRPSPYE